jgi:hypothetical protein
MSTVLLDAAGCRRSPATMPGFHSGRPPHNKRVRYPADPPSVEEIVAVMRHEQERRPTGLRMRGLIVLLWRAGLRIHEALALIEADLDARRGSVLVRRGKGGRRREVGMDDWAWEQLQQWLSVRVELPVGSLFCILTGPTRTSSATPTPSRWRARASRLWSFSASLDTPTLASPRRVGPGRGVGVTAGPFPRPALRTGRARSRASGSPQDMWWPILMLSSRGGGCRPRSGSACSGVRPRRGDVVTAIAVRHIPRALAVSRRPPRPGR